MVTRLVPQVAVLAAQARSERISTSRGTEESTLASTVATGRAVHRLEAATGVRTSTTNISDCKASRRRLNSGLYARWCAWLTLERRGATLSNQDLRYIPHALPDDGRGRDGGCPPPLPRPANLAVRAPV